MGVCNRGGRIPWCAATGKAGETESPEKARLLLRRDACLLLRRELSLPSPVDSSGWACGARGWGHLEAVCAAVSGALLGLGWGSSGARGRLLSGWRCGKLGARSGVAPGRSGCAPGWGRFSAKVEIGSGRYLVLRASNRGRHVGASGKWGIMTDEQVIKLWRSCKGMPAQRMTNIPAGVESFAVSCQVIVRRGLHNSLADYGDSEKRQRRLEEGAITLATVRHWGTV